MAAQGGPHFQLAQDAGAQVVVAQGQDNYDEFGVHPTITRAEPD